MNRVLGRNIYIVDLATVAAAAGGPQAFAQRCTDCKFNAVWVRLGHAQDLDTNFTDPGFAAIKSALAHAGVGLWGWHVPQCPDLDSADKEANLVISTAKNNALSGILLDAEQNGDNETRYFLGGNPEADHYASKIRNDCLLSGRGLALSSNDQPPKHQGFPFDIFLKYVYDNCPQVYYQASPAKTRLDLSIAGYKPLETGRNFQDRYKPVGNITLGDDVSLPDEQTCIQTTKEFMGLIKQYSFKAYSFWCWDEAPASIWQVFQQSAVLV
jgi:hypothetical protein